MMPVWPSDLPQCMRLDGRSAAIGDARIVSNTDAGGGKMRRRLSYVPHPFSGTFRMTLAELERFEAFVRDELEGGVLPFRFPAQRGGGEWVVQIGKAMPSDTQETGRTFALQLELVRLPQ